MISYIAVGTYTTKQPHVRKACGRGIPILSFDTEKGTLCETTVISDITDPTYLCWNSAAGKLYAVTESPKTDGIITSMKVVKKNNGTINLKSSTKVKGPGHAGCHLFHLPDNDRLYATAYADGVLEGYSLKNSDVSDSICQYRYSGSGPNTDRQIAPHAHQVMLSPDKHRLYVCDLGSDTIWTHKLDRAGIAGAPSAALKIPAGYGPRHMAFEPSASYAYILCELIPRLITARINPISGLMKIVSDNPTVKCPENNPANPAAIKLHPSGKSLAVSNRFQDTISIFKIDHRKTDSHSAEPEPILIDEFTCCGNTPRDISFSPDGEWLLIANQDSSSISVRKFNSVSGLPEKEWGAGLDTGSPVCITWLEGF